LRRGFSLFWAIGILLLIATLMTAVVKVAFLQVKHTSDTYMTQRAQLFMQSAIENALMAIEGYKRDGSCLENIHFSDEDDRFEANISVLRYYCYDLNDCPCNNAKKTTTSVSHGYVLLKVKVYSTDNPKNGGKRILLEKTTLQRP